LTPADTPCDPLFSITPDSVDWLIAADLSLIRVPQHGASARRVGGNTSTARAADDDDDQGGGRRPEASPSD
jgi:hypothetical protein